MWNISCMGPVSLILNDILFSVYIWHNLCLHLFLSFLDETNDCVFFKCIDAAFVERMYVRGVLDWILFYFFGRTKTLSAVCLYISFHHGCMENNVVLQVTTRSRWQKGTHTKKKHTHRKKSHCNHSSWYAYEENEGYSW